jgi:hypothetical protein
MKRNDRIKREAALTMEKIRAIARHIRNVEDNCVLIAEKLLEAGEIDLARSLVANGMVHDASKFKGIEWEYLSSGNPVEDGAKLKMKLAIHHHNSINKHHPDAWSKGIKEMPDVYLAEMAADWKSRSEEFGTDLRQWIDTVATKRYEFTPEDKVYKSLTRFVDLLCPKPFEDLSK